MICGNEYPPHSPPTNCSEIPNSSDDTISRQAAIDAAECIVEHHAITPYKTMAAAMEHLKRILNGMPSAQPERKKGHWIVWGGMDIPENHGKHKCSVCGEFAPVRYEKPLIKEYLSNFCPSCGSYNGG